MIVFSIALLTQKLSHAYKPRVTARGQWYVNFVKEFDPLGVCASAYGVCKTIAFVNVVINVVYLEHLI